MRAAAAVAAAAAVMLCVGTAHAALKVAPLHDGVYHSAHPDFGLRDDLVTRGRVRTFMRAAEHPLAWAYVSSHWDKGIAFPEKECRILNSMGIVPLIGIMPWSTLVQNEPEPVYTLERINRGYFDAEIGACADTAASLGFPIMIEFGPECNGPWFPWSAAHNGGSEDTYGERGVPDGAERFRDAYRRIIDIFREHGAEDVTWVFHIASGATSAEWNSASWYYPGDGYIDWLGMSVYGRRTGDDPARPFMDAVRHTYRGLEDLSPSKPIAVLEMGVSESYVLRDKAQWITDAFDAVYSGALPRLKAVSWWNKVYRPDGSRSLLEIDTSAESREAYRRAASRMRADVIFMEDHYPYDAETSE